MRKVFVGSTPAYVTPLGMVVYVKPRAEGNGRMHATNRAKERRVDPELLNAALATHADEIRTIAAQISSKRQTVIFRWRERRQTVVVEVGRKGGMPTVGIVTFIDVFKEHVHDGDIIFDFP